MATYSKYIGQPYESLSSGLILSGSSPYGFTNDYVLNDVYDNETKSVRPKNIRDMILSSWDSNSFKETTASGSSIYYIGFDSGDDSNRDIKGKKISIGKRSHESTEIMTSQLLSGDADIFFYNTKKDTISNSSTKVVFLSGKDAAQNQQAPYIQAQVIKVSGNTQSISLNIINPSGDISILSKGIDVAGQDTDTGGTVSINGIVFPTYDGSYVGGSASEKKTLSYYNGELVWEELTLPNNGYIGNTGSVQNIYGDIVNLNGYPLEFTESMFVPRVFGDVRLGSTFDGESITRLLEKMIYSYLAPECTISLENSTGYAEVGTYPQITLNYSITKRSNATLPTLLINMIPSSYPAIDTYEHKTINGTAEAVIISPVSATSSTFTIKVNDGTATNSESVSVTGIYPYFYGFTSSSTMTTSKLKSLQKVIEAKENKVIDIIGSGNFYFIYDAQYGPLSEIRDSYNTNIIGSFSVSTMVLSSPTGLWTSKQFLVYKWPDVEQVGPPSENFEFKY